MNDLIKLLGIVFLGAGAWYFYSNATTSEPVVEVLEALATPPVEKKITVAPQIINAAIADAASEAESIALAYAREQVELWHKDTMRKVDAYYLDWHFDYFRNFSDTLTTSLRSFWTDKHQLELERQEEIAGKFSRMITPPIIVEQTYRQIAEETVQIFAREFQKKAEEIPKQYELQKTNWERHLAGITLLTMNTEGQTEQPLSMKTMLIGGGAAAAVGSVALIELSLPLIDVALTTFGLELGLGAAVIEGSTLGGPFIAGLVAAAVGTWEFFDHKSTVARNKPLLREQLEEYLRGFETDQLKSSGAIGSPIHQLKVRISNSVGIEG